MTRKVVGVIVKRSRTMSRQRWGRSVRGGNGRASKGAAMIAASLGALVLMTACTSGGKDVSTEGSAPIDSNPLTELIKPKLTSTAADGDRKSTRLNSSH